MLFDTTRKRIPTKTVSHNVMLFAKTRKRITAKTVSHNDRKRFAHEHCSNVAETQGIAPEGAPTNQPIDRRNPRSRFHRKPPGVRRTATSR